jgi:hypothetical protein
MKLGIHFVNFTLPGGPEALGSTLGATALAAEEGGCAKLTLMYARLGVELVEVVPRSSDPVAEVTRLGEEVVPRLRELSGP